MRLLSLEQIACNDGGDCNENSQRPADAGAAHPGLIVIAHERPRSAESTQVKASAGRPDVVVSDLGLPSKFDGCEVARKPTG